MTSAIENGAFKLHSVIPRNLNIDGGLSAPSLDKEVSAHIPHRRTRADLRTLSKSALSCAVFLRKAFVFIGSVVGLAAVMLFFEARIRPLAGRWLERQKMPKNDHKVLRTPEVYIASSRNLLSSIDGAIPSSISSTFA